MRRDDWLRLAVVAALVGSSSCARDDERPGRLDAAVARRLDGTWAATFWLDPRRTVTMYAHASSPIRGTVVLAEDHYGRVSTEELAGATHDGVYDADFRPFGFSTRAAGEVPVAVARISRGASGDSVVVVLGPGVPRFAVRMSGVLVADSINGEWRAASHGAGGGAGRFTMRRGAALSP